MLPVWGLVVCSSCGVISAVASCYLIASLSRTKIEDRVKLMPRQLWHLAMADFGVALFGVCTFCLLSVRGFEHDVLMCSVLGVLELSVTCTSLLIESHLALAAVAALKRSCRFLRGLERTLCAVWPSGFVLGVVGVYADKLMSSSGSGCQRQKANIVAIIVGFQSVIVSMASYMTCLIYLRTRECVGYVVEQRLWKRTNSYMLAWLVCTLPNTVRVSLPNIVLDNSYNDAVFTVCVSLFMLTGAANVLVYVVHSGYLRRLEYRTRSRPVRRIAFPPSSERRVVSFSVAMGPVSVQSLSSDNEDRWESLDSLGSPEGVEVA